MPSGVVSCALRGFLATLLLNLAVIEELIFSPRHIQGPRVWRKQYQAEFANKLGPRGVSSQPSSQRLESERRNRYFCVFWLTLGQRSSVCR